MVSLGIENIALFITTGILLNLCPGPDTLYIVGRSLSQGRGAGVAAALGISSGCIVHTLLGGFGFSAILATSVHAFTILKVAGCGYLLYQGGRLLWGEDTRQVLQPGRKPKAELMVIYRQGALTNILNPKVAIFFLAFIPQFITASSSNKPLSFIILGSIFILTGTIWCLIIALFASVFHRRLGGSAVAAKRLRQASGIMFMLLGLKLVTSSFT